MRRRYFPSILLYGFGLALALSLAFNGFLLSKQSRQRSIYDDESGSSVHAVNDGLWQRQLSDCQQVNPSKDSRVVGSADSSTGQMPRPLPGQVVTVQHTPSN
ncbi:hypothetical protein [Spirosoma areae]